MTTLVIREDGTRHAGCDESPGWIWFSARQLETALGGEHNNNKTILELGSGTGWLSLQLAMRGATMTATDRPGALPLLLRNVLSNQERLQNLKVDVQELEWDSDERIVGQWDLIIGSDLIYVCESHIPLLETLLRHDCQTFVLTYEERKPTEEANFMLLAKERGFQIESLDHRGTNPGTGNAIWLLRMTYNQKEPSIA